MSVQSPRRNPIPFGTYLLLDRINIGGMAEVWRGKSFGAEGFERLVAIKRILPNIAEEADFKSMFIDEAKLSVLLSHANIAQVYELGDLYGSLYIAMEYVAGKDLRFVFERARKQQDPLPIPLVCHVIQRAAEGLDHAHRKKDQAGRELNIVHRDVSPQNILLSYDGEVKVIDFGIAKAAGWGTTTQTGVLKGKFGYMSPEQVLGQKVDRRSDVFALGVCLYELLTGERLFQGESDFSVLEKVANVDVQSARPSLQGLPAELSRIVTRALAKAPVDRYPFASDLADDLERYLHSSGRFFGRKDLMGFMHDAFGEDIDKELARQKDYAAIGATPEILEVIERGRSAKPHRPIRTRTGEAPLSLPPPDATLPEGQQTAAGSSRGHRAQAMRSGADVEATAEGLPLPIEATAPGVEHGEAGHPERTGTDLGAAPPGPATHIGPAPTSPSHALHLETHVGSPPEPKVDVALVSASTVVGPAPVRPSAGLADGDTRIGPAPKAPSGAAGQREVPRRSPTVGMPIPGILTMETHVGAAPLPPRPAPEASEDSTTGSGGDPRRSEDRSGGAGAAAEDDGDAAAAHEADELQRAEAATLAGPSRLEMEPAATLAAPSRLMSEPGATLPMPAALTEDASAQPPEATLPLPSRLSSDGSREWGNTASSPAVQGGADTLATPSRLGVESRELRSASARSSPPPEGAWGAASESPGRRRSRRGDSERGALSPAPSTPLPPRTEAGWGAEVEEVTDAEGQRRTAAGAAALGMRDEERSEQTDTRHRPRKGAGVSSAAAGYAEQVEEDTDAGRRYAELPEEDTDAGAHHRAAGVASRGGRLHPAGAPPSDDEAYDAEGPLDPEGASGLDEEEEDAEGSYVEDPETFARPQIAGRSRALPVGATRFDGLFDAKARRFTRRDMWLAGLAGAALAVVLTLLVSVISGPSGGGMVLVEVVGVAPSKTTVRLAGKELPRALNFPVTAPAPLGEVEVELSAEGYRPAKHLLRLTQPGEVAELRTSLEPL